MSRVDFAYGQTRVQARLGARPQERTWRRLHASGSWAHFLEAARASELRPWLSAIHGDSDADAVDSALRRAFAVHVLEVATWYPAVWTPVFELLARWTEPAEFRLGALEELRAVLPSMRARERAEVDAFIEEILRHRLRMAAAPPSEDGWRLRAALERDTARRFRAQAEQPVAAFCYLALAFFDLERLRGALLRRLLFADVQSEVAWV